MPTGSTTVAAHFLQDASGVLIANATIYFKPVDNKGDPISFRGGPPDSAGQVSRNSVQAAVINGVFSVVLADTTLTTPANIGYSVSCIDNVSGKELLGPGYGCIQPSGPTWSFDGYVPNTVAQAPMNIVDGLIPKGTYDPSRTYGMGEVVRFGDASYASMIPNNTHLITDRETDAFWMLLTQDGETNVVGPPGPGWDPAGPYDAGSTYVIGKAVSYSGQSYVSIQNGNEGHPPSSSPSWWMLLAAAGANGAPGAAGIAGAVGSPGDGGKFLINPRGDYDPAVTYAKADAVSFGGFLWVSPADGNIGHQPDTSPGFWIKASTNGIPGGILNTIFGSNQFMGDQTPTNPGTRNVVAGVNAGGSLFTGAGGDAGTGGENNVIIGNGAAPAATTMRESVVIGADAGAHITGNGTGADDMIVVLIGSLAGAGLTDQGGSTVAIGQKSLITATVAYQTVAIGVHSATGVLSSVNDVIIGAVALDGAGSTPTTNDNVIIGTGAGAFCTSGVKSGNVVIGSSAAAVLDAAVENVLIGYKVASGMKSGFGNVIIGTHAEVNGPGPISGYNNVALGTAAGALLTTGHENVILGSGAALAAASDNFIVGVQGGNGLIGTATYNICLLDGGGNPRSADITGLVCLGGTMSPSTGDQYCMGTHSGQSLTTGVNNIFFGKNSGGSITTGSNNTLIGNGAGPLLQFSDGDEHDDIAIGAGAAMNNGVVNAIQMGSGKNFVSNSFQVGNHRILDIPSGTLYSLDKPVWANEPHNLVTTANATDSITVTTYMQNVTNVQISARNDIAAGMLTSTWAEIPNGNTVTIHHPATAGAIFDVLLTFAF
jgi:hypothetical protein